MEKHRCNLCLKNFSNGRALGGHMRSHMLNLSIAHQTTQEEEEEHPGSNQLVSDDTEFASSPSSSAPSDEEESEERDEKGVYYGLRENPKRSIRLVDPEFSFAVDVAGSIILQDRESETESSKNPTHRRRSKRTRKFDSHQYHHHHQLQRQQEMTMLKKLKFNNKLNKTESWGAAAVEPEPVSSISDTTTEEDVAFCLMMLSRDKWKRKEQRHQVLEEDQEHEEAEKSREETDESDEFKSSKQRTPRKYKCETCKKVFKSYQALGGHRASHKKIKFYSPTKEPELEQENAGTSTSVVQVLDKKIHECPVCFRVFSSGQALGGHKRTHVTGLVTTTTPARSCTKLGDNLIDLNLPAPIDDDDISQIELSAVSDAEFVNHIKR